MNMIVDFFTSPAFVVISKISTVLVIIAVIRVVWDMFYGISPVVYRLGLGLSRRKIAVFANADNFSFLRDVLTESGMFKSDNIIHVPSNNVDKAKNYSIFLLHWKDSSEILERILNIKEKSTGLVIYAPQEEGKIPDEKIPIINSYTNAIVVNLRGRLLNDIMVTLITTEYQKKSH